MNVRKFKWLAYLAVFIAAMVLMIKFLPWWTSLLILFGFFAGGILLVRWYLKKLVSLPFQLMEMKGQALKGATAEIHAVTKSESPKEEDEFEGNDGLREFFLIEATISPAASIGTPFSYWEPADLSLALPGSNILKDESARDVCSVYKVELVGEKEEDSGKYEGARRIRMHVGIRQGVHDLVFLYYFEKFGSLSLPS